jgi:hypothetical protein
MKFLAAAAAAVSLFAVPALAAEPSAPVAQPVTLSDSQLDEVTAGESLVDLFVPITLNLSNIGVSVNLSNVPVNAAVALQANALGTAQQTASVIAYQSVAQLSQ